MATIKRKKNHQVPGRESLYVPTKLGHFEFRIFRELQGHTTGKKILVACSGGCDSIALGHVLANLSQRLGHQIGLAYVHHGDHENRALVEFRAQAAKKVRAFAEKVQVPFHHSPARSVKSRLRSEAELRTFRYDALEKIRKRMGYDQIALAHHADDLFETRLIRLIRGTGLQGLEAMRPQQDGKLRPFLKESRAEIRTYAEQNKLDWIEDPSNLESHPLRNWLRLVWLEELEKKRPGACGAFARSLEQIVATASLVESTSSRSLVAENSGIDRQRFQTLTPNEKRQVLAAYLRERGVNAFAATHIEEIRKRVESPRKFLSFELLKLQWDINAEQILAKPIAK